MLRPATAGEDLIARLQTSDAIVDLGNGEGCNRRLPGIGGVEPPHDARVRSLDRTWKLPDVQTIAAQ